LLRGQVENQILLDGMKPTGSETMRMSLEFLPFLPWLDPLVFILFFI